MQQRSDAWPQAAFLIFVLTLVSVQSSIAMIDPPAGLLTWSADLLTDQGFQTKAAQLWAKFGQWSTPFDMDFRPAAPFYTLIIGAVFRIFGVHAGTLAGYAIAVNALTLVVAHAIARTIFRPWMAAFVAASFGLCFPSFSFARLALIEPTAILFGLLGVLFHARGPKVSAVCLSMGFAAAAMMTKIHFASVVVALALAWLVDVRRLARTDRRSAVRLASALGVMLALTLAAAAAYAWAFASQIETFRATVADSIAGGFTARRLLVPLQVIGPEMAYSTRLPMMMLLIACYGLVMLWRRGRNRGIAGRLDAASPPPRAILALALWAAVGIALVSALDYRPTRYMLFLLYPVVVLGAYAASRFSARLAGPAIASALLLMLAYQAPLYGRWLERPARYSKQQAFAAIVGRIETQSSGRIIPVIGQEAAELGLRSSRIMPLEAGFVPSTRYSLCQRLAYWRPRFYVRLDHEPGETRPLSSCHQLDGETKLATYRVLGGYKGKLVLYRLSYQEPTGGVSMSPGVQALSTRMGGRG